MPILSYLGNFEWWRFVDLYAGCRSRCWMLNLSVFLKSTLLISYLLPQHGRTHNGYRSSRASRSHRARDINLFWLISTFFGWYFDPTNSSSLSKPTAYITHNATHLPTVHLEILLCYSSSSWSGLEPLVASMRSRLQSYS